MPKRIVNYTDEDIIEIAKNVKSMAGLLKGVGLKPVGGNYANMNRKLQLLNVNTDHWTRQLWSKGRQLKDWSTYTRAYNFRKHLINERGNQCEECKLTTWLDYPIKLELHHIDGDRTNNVIENLQLLCPNCHSFTDTWRKSSTLF
jgi:5-methylcytosine-specific restriction endonuclease McrA